MSRIGVPNVSAFADPIRLVDLGRETEAAGDGFFVWDHLLYRNERPRRRRPVERHCRRSRR